MSMFNDISWKECDPRSWIRKNGVDGKRIEKLSQQDKNDQI